MSTNKQVAHLFAHKQSGSSNNLHSDGRELRSYSTVIAFWANDVMFISSNTMTPTTGSKHLSPLRSAASHVRTFYSSAFGQYRGTPNVRECIEAAAADLLRDFKGLHRKRVNLEFSIEWYEKRRADVVEIAQLFNVELPELPEASGDLKEKAKQLEAQEKERRKEKERKEEEHKAQKRQEDLEQFNTWLTTGTGRFPASYARNYHDATATDFITVKDGMLQEVLSRADGNVTTPRRVMDYNATTVITSQGAEAPLDHVRKAVEFYLSRQLPALHFPSCDYRSSSKTRPCTCGGGADQYTPYHTNGHKIHLGHFTLDEIDEHGNVKAGCHRFTAAEIARFIEQWKEVL